MRRLMIGSQFCLILFLIFLVFDCNAQVGVNTTNPQGSLDVTSTNDGILIPRVALAATDVATIITPTESEIVYNTFTSAAGANAVTPGFYYWNGTLWIRISTGNNTGWATNGNAGTSAGTNFIGTNDTQDFIIKTDGNAAINERMRFLSFGQASFNNSTPFSNDVFSVYGSGFPGSLNALGNSSINGYVGSGGIGIYGESNSANDNNGVGVFGLLSGASTATTTSSYGVFGVNNTIPTGTGIAIGVAGQNTATTGDSRGVNGTVSSPTGKGVAGFNTALTGASYGLYGQTSSVAGIGIYGINSAAAYTTNTAVGVLGIAQGTVTSGTSIGVRGYSFAATGNGHGFYAQALSNTAIGGISFVTSSGAGWQGQNSGTGDGIRGINNNPSNANAGSGVYGQTGAINNMGGEFYNTNAANGTGVLGAGNNLPGFYLTRGSGIAASGTRFGVAGFATTTEVTNPLNTANTNGDNASAGGYFEVQNAGIPLTWSYVGVREVSGAGGLRKIIGTGTVNTIVKDLKNNYVALSCPETPENLFQDFGQGQLINGKIHIDIDPILVKNIVVDAKHPLRVFIQLEGDCEGVYVTNKTQNGFDVIELKGGTSNTPFSYTISANRADEVLSDGSIAKYSIERFAPAPGPQEKNRIDAVSKEKRTNIIQEPIVPPDLTNDKPSGSKEFSELVEKKINK
ncbi:hypothetical protein [Flavobacterium sp.]|jgi:hypothetical protein|uniref:hypothetical protein n=1 Tax=Flavobacterium sp. TaxID=239 RepID=UPI0037BF6B34